MQGDSAEPRRVVYAGGFRLYPPDAAGRRVLGIVRLLAQEGYEVVLCPANGRAPEGEAFSADQDYEQPRPFEQQPHFFQSRVAASAVRRHRPCAVFVYNPTNLMALWVRLAAFRTGTAFILDTTEWYEYAHLGSIKWVAEVFVRMNVVYRLFAYALCGSRYLAERFGRRKSVVIPPIPSIPLRTAPGPAPLPPGPLRICYVGFPGRGKDKIAEMIGLLDSVAARVALPIELHLAGPERERSEQQPVTSPNLRVVAHGRLDHQAVIDLYGTSHFSAIIRDNARYEWAGFPLKPIESWTCGVPTLVMSHSRFAQVATGYGAVVVIDEHDPAGSLARQLERIYADPAAYEKMSAGALNVARERYRPESHREVLRELMRAACK